MSTAASASSAFASVAETILRDDDSETAGAVKKKKEKKEKKPKAGADKKEKTHKADAGKKEKSHKADADKKQKKHTADTEKQEKKHKAESDAKKEQKHNPCTPKKSAKGGADTVTTEGPNDAMEEAATGDTEVQVHNSDDTTVVKTKKSKTDKGDQGGKDGDACPPQMPSRQADDSIPLSECRSASSEIAHDKSTSIITMLNRNQKKNGPDNTDTTQTNKHKTQTRSDPNQK